MQPVFSSKAAAPTERGALTEPAPVRWALIGVALGFLSLFLLVPLAAVLPGCEGGSLRSGSRSPRWSAIRLTR
jgi:sulfate transport system permease protein